MTLPTVNSKQFLLEKEQCLSGIDLSRKGSVDAPVVDLVNFINSQLDCFTTSSCSGRIIVVDNTNENGEVEKKGCRWLFLTHEEACWPSIKASLMGLKGAAVFKFEPMVMHIQVRTLQLAQQVLTAAVASGFRNSGITIGRKGKIIVIHRDFLKRQRQAASGSLSLPVSFFRQFGVPIHLKFLFLMMGNYWSALSLDGMYSKAGLTLTPASLLHWELKITIDNGFRSLSLFFKYVQHLVQCANIKMRENTIRIARFFDKFRNVAKNSLVQVTKNEKKKPSLCHHCPSSQSACKKLALQTCITADSIPPDNTGGIEECFDSLLFEET